MAILAFGAMGAALGSTLLGTSAIAFGMTGTSIGWALGTFVGGQLMQKDVSLSQEGPRITDLKVQVSAYGQAIPEVFGRARVAGNLIWSSDIIEASHTESHDQGGGKGGGPDTTVTTTTYSYYSHLAVGVCEGVIGGIRKIWANGKLIYNVSDTANAETVFASNQRADGIRFYMGSASQLADPIIEAYEGAGNVPAYRNLAYVVLENFQLAEFGNRIPNFEFEVLSSATTAYFVRYGASNFAGNGSTQQTEFKEGVLDTIWTNFTGGGPGSITLGYRRRVTDINGTLYSYATYAGLADTYNVSVGTSNPWGNWPGVWASADFGSPLLRWKNFLTGAKSQGGVNTALVVLYLFKAGDVAIAVSQDNSLTDIVLHKYGVDTVNDVPTVNALASTTVPVVGALAYQKYRAYFDGTYLWLGYSNLGFLQKYDLSLTLLGTWTFTPIATANARSLVVTGDRVYFGRGAQGTESGSAVYRLNADFTATHLQSANFETLVNDRLYPYAGGLVVGFDSVINIADSVTPSNPLLSAVAQSLCLDGGLSAGELDVTALASTSVTGYVRARRMPVRAALEPLMTAYMFDAVESDGKVKFVRRGGVSAVTIAAADLAARQADGRLPAPVTHTRSEDLELPTEIAVTFMNDTYGYQQGAQYGRRLATSAVGRGTIELPLVLTDAQAKAVADAQLFDAWAVRDRFLFQTGRKYAKYEPGDVLTVPFGAATIELRIEKRDDGANGVIDWEGAYTDASVYTQSATTQSAPVQDGSLSVRGPTMAELMDIPLLRESDDTYGFYAAAAGVMEGWRGAVLFRSTDSGGSYDALDDAVFLTGAALGVAETALGTVSVYDVFDETNTVDVSIYDGELSSVTRDQVLNGANAALLGGEVIQFRDATLLSAGHYRLAGLLRGRVGTDRNVGTHAIGERFVLLSSSTVRFVPQSSADVGVQRHFKAVSIGNTLPGTAAEALTYAAENLKPLAPVHVTGGRDASLNLSISWKRRTRLSGVWRDYVDAPLGEASESYEIDIMSGSVVKRTITASTNSATYTAAQQITDFAGTQASVTLNLYQLSSRVGRGHARSATI